MRASGLALVILVVATSLGQATAAEEPRLTASTYRVDLGALVPGETRGGEVVLSNPGYAPLEVRLVHEGDPALVETPALVTLPPGTSAPVRYVVHVRDDARAGFHGEALRLVPRKVDVVAGAGTLDAGTAIVFTWRTTAVGIAGIEAPALVLPGENVSGQLILVNTWTEAVDATVRVEWRDPAGATVQAMRLEPTRIDANGSARVPFALAAAVAPAGVQSLHARVLDAGPAPIAGPAEQAFSLGRQQAIVRLDGAEDLRDGNASVGVVVENTGDVPITLVPRVRVRAADGTERIIELAAVTLAAGESRRMEAAIALPPGTFSLDAEADGAESAIVPASEDATASLVMAKPAADRAPLLRAASILLVTLIALLASAYGAFRLALALRRRRDERAPPPADLADEAFDALFTKLAEPAKPGVACALLVDVDSLSPGLGLFELARGRTVDVAYAYARAGTPEGARDVSAALAALGFVPRVLVGVDDFRIEISLDASLEARAGRAVVLATGDPAFARLAGALEREGAVVDVLRLPRRVPVTDHSRSLAATLPST